MPTQSRKKAQNQTAARNAAFVGAIVMVVFVVVGLGAVKELRIAQAGLQPPQSYSRFEEDPFDLYNFANTQTSVNKIRAEGHSIPTGHPRIFIKPTNKDALRLQVQTHFLDWMRAAVSLADANYGKTLTNLGGYDNEPDAQPVILADALIYQLGTIPGVTYQHTPEEYGKDGIRHMLSLFDFRTLRIEYLGLPLGYDWLYELMTDDERKAIAEKLLEIAQPKGGHIIDYNHPAGSRLLGALAVYGDSVVDQIEVQKTLDFFYNGMVFGDSNVPQTGENIMTDLVFTPEGPGVAGFSYAGEYYHILYLMLLAWRDQTGEDYFKLPFFQNWAFYHSHFHGNKYERRGARGHLKDLPWDTRHTSSHLSRVCKISCVNGIMGR